MTRASIARVVATDAVTAFIARLRCGNGNGDATEPARCDVGGAE